MGFNIATTSERALKQIEDEMKHCQTKRYNQTEKQRVDNFLKQKGIFAKCLLNLRMLTLPAKT
jgi:hypothetical protein